MKIQWIETVKWWIRNFFYNIEPKVPNNYHRVVNFLRTDVGYVHLIDDNDKWILPVCVKSPKDVIMIRVWWLPFLKRYYFALPENHNIRNNAYYYAAYTLPSCINEVTKEPITSERLLDHIIETLKRAYKEESHWYAPNNNLNVT